MICSVAAHTIGTKNAYDGEIARNRCFPEHRDIKYDKNPRTPTFLFGCCGFLLSSCKGCDKGNKPFLIK